MALSSLDVSLRAVRLGAWRIIYDPDFVSAKKKNAQKRQAAIKKDIVQKEGTSCFLRLDSSSTFPCGRAFLVTDYSEPVCKTK